MRKMWYAASAICLTLLASPSLRAEGKGDAQAIIDKAIAAMGGEAAIKKANGMTWNEKGTYYGMGDGLPYTAKEAVQYPDKSRMEIEGVFTMIMNGNKGWMVTGGQTIDMNKEQLDEQLEARHGGNVATLVVLKDKAYTVTTLSESKVGSTPVVGIKVSHKGHNDVKLYFSKDTYLLLKTEQKVKAADMGGKEVVHEGIFSNYKDVDGFKTPTKVVVNRDGKKFVEAEVFDVKIAEKLDDKLFEKP